MLVVQIVGLPIYGCVFIPQMITESKTHEYFYYIKYDVAEPTEE